MARGAYCFVIIASTYQKSDETVNFCTSLGEEKYKPCPRELKQNVLAILARYKQTVLNAMNTVPDDMRIEDSSISLQIRTKVAKITGGYQWCQQTKLP